MDTKKIIDNIVLILVGGLFIFSGLIKVNDPIGTSIKLKEYFEVFSADFASFFHIFAPISLPIAVFIVVLEVMLGFAVLLRYRMKITAWVLLLLIVFFTFLTFYSAFTGNVTDCGCFGDAIKLTPWESFSKDVVLLVLIIYLFIFRKRFSPLFKLRIGDVIMVAITGVNLFLAINAINHLPYIDFRPYHVGADIQKSMKPSEPLEYIYIMEKEGQQYEFENYPEDTTYEYVDMKLKNPEAQPKITDYNVWKDEGDYTEASFEGDKLFVIFQDVNKAGLSDMPEIRKLVKDLEGKLDIWALTANDAGTFEAFRHEYQLAIPYYYADGTVLKAMIRANPGIMLLRDGVVKAKWHHNDTPQASQVLELLN